MSPFQPDDTTKRIKTQVASVRGPTDPRVLPSVLAQGHEPTCELGWKALASPLYFRAKNPQDIAKALWEEPVHA